MHIRRLHNPSLGILLGLSMDRLLGDPGGKYHPVAVFGRYASMVERKLYRDSKAAGVAYVAACIAPPAVAAAAAAHKAPTVSLAVALATALGGTTLERTGRRMAARLDANDLAGARALIPWLCSRDPQYLDELDIARATVESLAENTADAASAPLFWSCLGAPMVITHRCVNTLDAMVGYQSPRYQQFGWAAAKVDDLLAYIPARVTAGVHVLYATVHGRGKQALRAWKEDAPQHPSPNAGPVEATAAAALGVQLGGTTRYAHGVEERPRLGRGAKPTADTIRQAIVLSRYTQLSLALLAVVLFSVGSGWGGYCRSENA